MIIFFWLALGAIGYLTGKAIDGKRLTLGLTALLLMYFSGIVAGILIAVKTPL